MFAVVPITLTISLCLVFTFVILFWREYSRRRFRSAESESLLPLASESRQLASPGAPTAAVTADSGASQSSSNSSSGPVVLDLGGRLPAKRRRPCGSHGDGSGGNCDNCEHKHEHHDHDHHGASECHGGHGNCQRSSHS